jgi:hypothetical protein
MAVSSRSQSPEVHLPQDEQSFALFALLALLSQITDFLTLPN